MKNQTREFIANGYWRGKLSDCESSYKITDIPLEYSTKIYSIDDKIEKSINELSKGQEIAKYTIYLTIFKILINRFISERNGVILTPDFILPQINYTGKVDKLYFIKIANKENETLKTSIEQTKQDIQDCLRYKDFSFEHFIENLDSGFLEEKGFWTFGFSYDKINQPSIFLSQCLLKLEIFHEKDNCYLKVRSNSHLFKEVYIDQLVQCYFSVLEPLKNNLNSFVSKLSLLSENEENKFLEKLELPYTKNETQFSSVIDCFVKQVNANPKNNAIYFEDEFYSYEELNRKSDNIAFTLKEEYKVSEGDYIGVCIEHSFNYITVILGILKCGAIYVPVENKLPVNRIQYIINDTKLSLIIRESNVVLDLADSNVTYFDIEDSLDKQVNSYVFDYSISKFNSTAYVMYTSGSTGIPKGVEVAHKSIVNLVKSQNYFTLDNKDKVLQTGALSFDASTFEIWGTLLNGATLFVLSSSKIYDNESIKLFVAKHKITSSWFTSSFFNNLIDYDIEMFKFLDQILVGGEKLSINHVKRFKERFPNKRLINGYGPTECTTFSLCHKIDEITSNSLPIGLPIDNVNAYILDEYLNRLPPFVNGELHLSGYGVSYGYLNDEELTKERFIENPFKKGEKLYRTGDICRLNENGLVEFIGRSDDQIKLRGYRIELSEIENNLNSIHGVKGAKVICFNQSEVDKELFAFVQLDNEVTIEHTKKELKEKLPIFMIPSRIFAVNEFPINNNGKIDSKKLLSEYLHKENPNEHLAPETKIERGIYQIWKEILGNSSFGINDNFFEIGGHSLRANRFISLLYKKLNISIELNIVFNYSTIRELANYIESIDFNSYQNIYPIEVADYYSISHAQRRIWILSQLNNANSAYNVHGAYEFLGDMDLLVLELAINSLFDRHEILRTVFRETNEDVYQYILPLEEVRFEMDYVDMRSQEEFLINNIDELISIPFNLEKGPLFRATLYRLDDQKFVFVYVIHHIISDARSMDILLKELVTIYKTYKSDSPNLLEPLRVQYKDYVHWQLLRLSGEELESCKSYWLEHFKGDLPVLDLPSDKPRPSVKTYRGGLVRGFIKKTNVIKFRSLLESKSSTMLMGLLSVVNVLFYKYTGKEDIILGSPASGRNHPDLEEQIGFYINTLALRTIFDGNDSYEVLLDKVKKVCLGAYSNQLYPFDELINELSISHDASRNPLFDVMVTYQGEDNNLSNLVLEEKQINRDEIVVQNYGANIVPVISKFDLIIGFTDSGDDLGVGIEYSTDLFEKSTIERMLGHVESLIEALVTRPKMAIHSLEYLEKSERNKLLETFNASGLSYSKEITVLDLIEKQVNEIPENISLICDGNSLTYKNLNELSNQYAWYLQSHYATGKEKLIAVKMERSLEMIVSILAILKTGSAYLPIDPTYPEDRVSYMLEDSNCKILLDKFEYNRFVAERTSYEANNLHVNINGTDLAYVIYTSGSTGLPKGVMIEHQNLNAFIHWSFKEFKDSTFDKTLFVTSICFDLSIFEIFFTLASGKILEILDNGSSIPQYLDSEFKLLINTVPSVVGMLLKDNIDLSSVSILNMAGEPIKPNYLEGLRGKVEEIRNLYGPTEATTYSTIFRMDFEDRVLIGSPISNTQIYILNESHKIQPIGVVGEIYIGGSGLARGYINRPDLTLEKFIDHPFIKGERLYKTGDIGRWLMDGNIEFIGRKDDQVKVRGYRIELGEIESVIQQYDEVLSNLVISKKLVSGDNELVAYIIGEKGIEIKGLRAYLKTKLPDYMIPPYFVELDEFPLTPNGKLDKKSLPSPEEFNVITGVEYIAPRNSIEEKLAHAWSKVLNVDKSLIGVNDNFFEIGGNSLKLMKLSNLIYREFNVKLKIFSFFQNSEITSQSNLIKGVDTEMFQRIPKTLEKSKFKLSYAQMRVWTVCRFLEANIAHNIPDIYQLDGKIDRRVLNKSLNELLIRHEILRTVFRELDADVYQYILSTEELNFQMDYQDLRSESSLLSEEIDKLTSSPFDLEKGPLFRASLFRIADDKYVFGYVMHHIISDGWSMDILLKELLLLYNSDSTGSPNPLEPLRIQYKDYSSWQLSKLGSEEFESHKSYWLSRFEGEIPVLEMPTDNLRPPVKTYKGDVHSYTISQDLTENFKMLMKDNDCTLFMGFATILNILLYRYTGQNDIILGTPISSRNHVDLENQIGFYVNTLALRTHFDGNDPFKKLLNKVKSVVLEGFENQAYPFDQLIDDLKSYREPSRSPLFDVFIAIQNDAIEVTSSNIKNIEVSKPKWNSHNTSKFDLTFVLTERDNGLNCSIEFNTDLFKKESIDKIYHSFITILKGVVKNDSLPLSKINSIDAKTYNEIIEYSQGQETHVEKDSNIIELFERNAGNKPDNIAVSYKNKNYTYSEINKLSNQFSNFLEEGYGVKKGDYVGVKVERSEWLIVSILGILKTGVAFIPIDNKLPPSRIDMIQKDSNCKAIIDDSLLNFFSICSHKYDSDNKRIRVKDYDAAYAVYTSGSTGEPKGIIVEHFNLLNLITWHNKKFNINEFDRATKYTAWGYDDSIWEIFPYLTIGASIHIIPNEILLDMEKLNSFYELHKISISFLPTHICKQFIQINNKSLRVLLTGGNRLINVEKIHGNYELYNNYGPSECTVVTNCYKVTEGLDLIPIGKPIDNVQTYILDENLNIQPIGAVGEICIAGDAVARGYLNNKEKKQDNFIENPFKKGGRLYKTGDLGSVMSNGNVQFLGRNDEQIKLRGYRIELGEVENCILKVEGIDTVKLTVRKAKDFSAELIAYYTSELEYSVSMLREKLQVQLPEYMIPIDFIKIDMIPLRENGKIDRKRLFGNRKSERIKNKGESILNKIESEITEIWSDLLEIQKQDIDIDDDFFKLGGHSLVAIKLYVSINQKFDLNLELNEFFMNTTVSSQCELIEKTIKSIHEDIPKINEVDKYKVSSAQRRLWVICKFEEANAAYNVPLFIEIDGKIDQKVLHKSLNELLDRHEILRTVFHESDSDVYQHILSVEELDLQMIYKDLCSENSLLPGEIDKLTSSPFDLEQGPLFRASLFRIADDKYVFGYVMHHIISDGWSMDILLKELLLLYNSYSAGSPSPLTPLRIQYKDYSSWQLSKLGSEEFESHKSYWLSRFEGEIPVLEMPTDNVRPPVKTYRGGIVNQTINQELTNSLKELTQENDSTLFMGLISIVNVLLYRYTGQNDITLGSPIAGRNHIDLEDQIGFYVNTLALRTHFDGSDTYEKVLSKVKLVVLGAFKHQAYPFDTLVDELKLHREPSRSPLFDAMLVYRKIDEKEFVQFSDGKLKGYNIDNNEDIFSKFDFTIFFTERENDILLSIEYNKDIFKNWFISRMQKHLIGLLGEVVHKNNVIIDHLNYYNQDNTSSFSIGSNVELNGFSVIKSFEDIANQKGNDKALVFGNKEFTYLELNYTINSFAGYLSKYLDDNDKNYIYILIERSEWSVITMFSLFKLGVIYVPIDISWPKNRILNVLRENKAQFVITQSKILEDFKDLNDITIITIESFVEQENEHYSAKEVDENSTSYIVYTSGSTGIPKGVEQTHSTINNLIHWEINDCDMLKKTKHLQFSSFSFDSSINDSCYVLSTGGELHIVDERLRKDIYALLEYIINEKIEVVSMPYSALKVLFNEFSLDKFKGHSIKEIISTGEQLYIDGNLREFLKYNPKIKICNLYGPSETHVISGISYTYSDSLPIKPSIGKPINNNSIYILDDNDRVVPEGIAGEIYATGKNLALGYQNQVELTKLSFVQNPFDSSQILYKTGDKGKWLPNGEIEYLGRKDNQFKINGFRIELEEIKLTMKSYPLIKDAVILVKENLDEDKIICAYYIPVNKFDSDDLLRFMKLNLPSYMIPNQIFELDNFPTTINGKIDEGKLLSIKYKVTSNTLPTTDVEIKLANVWKELIPIKGEVFLEDDFFVLGGNSLKANIMITRIHSDFNVKIKIEDFYKNTVFKNLINEINILIWLNQDQNKEGKELHKKSLEF